MINVAIYNEFQHERNEEAIARVYPDGIHMCIKRFLESDDIRVRTVTVDDVEEGLSEEALASTDVLLWWGHMAHNRVPDAVAQRVQQAVLKGMGMVFLHSGHHSKPFRLLMGTTCNLTWREDGDFERVWVVNPAHDRVLMVYHRIYDSWSWTGGHADGEEDLLAVALRECREETGLQKVRAVSDEILSLEVLTVEGHEKRGEYVPSHLHLNVTYLLEADESETLRICEEENAGVAWFTLDGALEASSEPWFVERIYKKLNEKVKTCCG